MTNAVTKCSILILTVTAPGTPVCADEPPELEHNPFTRPYSKIDVNRANVDDADSGPMPAIDLKATLVGGSKGSANIAGRVLRPGDEVGSYRLVRVYEDRAVFSRDGEYLTVYVKPELNENNE